MGLLFVKGDIHLRKGSDISALLDRQGGITRIRENRGGGVAPGYA